MEHSDRQATVRGRGWEWVSIPQSERADLGAHYAFPSLWIAIGASQEFLTVRSAEFSRKFIPRLTYSLIAEDFPVQQYATTAMAILPFQLAAGPNGCRLTLACGSVVPPYNSTTVHDWRQGSSPGFVPQPSGWQALSYLHVELA